jgi:hypothetical protein
MMMMMKNANDIAKMNMKNSAISSSATAIGVLGSEKQLFASNKNQSISKNIFTSFCEIKTENYPQAFDIATLTPADNNCLNQMNSSTPPPLPRKNSILRRYVNFYILFSPQKTHALIVILKEKRYLRD